MKSSKKTTKVSANNAISPKYKVLLAIIVGALVIITTSFASGYYVGNHIGYEKGKSENDVILSKVLKDIVGNRADMEDFMDSSDSKYAAFGEVIEEDEKSLTLMNFLGIERKVIKTDYVDLSDIDERDRIFVVGEPTGDNNLEARFYKKLPIPALKLFGE